MSALTALDTSQQTTPLSVQQLQPNQLTTTAKEIEKNSKLETPNVAALDEETPKVDLSNYYSNVQAPEQRGNHYDGQEFQNSGAESSMQTHVTQAGQNLSNAIAAAVSHGMNPQDAVNLQKAKVAYESTMNTAQTSTFELEVA